MMKLSTRTRYGIRAMIDITIYSVRGPVFLKDICRRQKLSLKYMDHIITTLKLSGLIKNANGKRKGYILSRDPGDITAYDIVVATEGGTGVVDCTDSGENCTRSGKCAAQLLWGNMDTAIKKSLDIDLLTLVKNQIKMQGGVKDNNSGISGASGGKRKKKRTAYEKKKQ